MARAAGLASDVERIAAARIAAEAVRDRFAFCAGWHNMAGGDLELYMDSRGGITLHDLGADPMRDAPAPGPPTFAPVTWRAGMEVDVDALAELTPTFFELDPRRPRAWRPGGSAV